MMEERMRILEMIEQGVITAEQGAQLIAALESQVEETRSPPSEAEALAGDAGSDQPDDFESTETTRVDETNPPTGAHPEARFANIPPNQTEPLPEVDPKSKATAEPPPDLRKWRSWWVYPLGIGSGITILSGLLIYQGNQAGWHWFWMVSIWVPLLLGIALITFAWATRSARWLHVRVQTGQDEWPRRIAISFPLPIRLSAWGLRHFGHFIPGMENTALDEIILALGDSATPESPLYIEVDEGEGNERVQVYIG